MMIHIDIRERNMEEERERKINTDLPLFLLLVMPKKKYILYIYYESLGAGEI